MIYVNYLSVCTVDERSDEDYGDWRQEFDFDILSVTTKPTKNDFEDFNVDLKVGDECFVLYYTYSDGDSFGSCSGQGVVAMVYKYLENAEFAKGAFESASDGSMKIGIPIERENGAIEIAQIGNPTYDYFSHLENVEIVRMIVQ